MLLEEAASWLALRNGLATALANRGAPGPDGVRPSDFAARADAELGALREELLSGTFQPRAARRVQIPKAGGGHRYLAIGCVRDRVVQHALAATLAAAFDGVLHPCAFAYRRGRSIHAALAAVDAALAAGNAWVLRGDVEAFFDRIPPALLLASLEEVTAEPVLVQTVERFLSAGALAGATLCDSGIGVPQGSPLSPFLANLYLLPFDTAIERAGFGMVRYGDDLCICVPSRAEAERARSLVSDGLARLRLGLNPNKVSIRHRGEGFTFLGFQFHASGRRASAKAARGLARRVEALLAEGQDPAALDAELRGWLAYYGSLQGVELPPAARARAESLEATRAEARLEGQSQELSEPEPEPATPAAAVSRWVDAAREVHECRDAPDSVGRLERLRDALGIDVCAWPLIEGALARGDGGALAEALARLGRYADATEAASLTPDVLPVASPAARRQPDVAVEPDALERPRLDFGALHVERLAALFAGAEHAYALERDLQGKTVCQRQPEPLTLEQFRQHLEGHYWLGVYPLRANSSSRFGALRIVSSAKSKASPPSPPAASAADDVIAAARAARAALIQLGLSPVISQEPGRGFMLWLLSAEPQPAPRLRAVLERACQRAGSVPQGVVREIIPAQNSTRPDKPGTPARVPLGLDPRTRERAWLCGPDLAPLLDPAAALLDLIPDSAAAIGAASRAEASAPAPGAVASPLPPPIDPGIRAVEAATSPFRELRRAREIYEGCVVHRHFVDKAVGGKGLPTSERYLVADAFGRLGDESTAAVDAVFRHLDDYRPGMAARHLTRLYPHPTSCGRIRQKLPELTAELGCDCRFRVPPGAYPTPVLHAVGAAQVPGLSDRVRDAATRGGIARAVVAAMNEGRKELGAKAAALCTRLADLRRQAQLLQRAITNVEAELDGIVDEAGDTPLQTPAGTLRRVSDGAERRFVLDV